MSRIINSINTSKIFYIIILSIFFALVLSLSVLLIPFAKSQKVIFIVILCVLLFSITSTYALVYFFKGSTANFEVNKNIFKRFKFEIALIILIVIAAYPLLVKSYFCFDDWWNIGNKSLLTKQFLLILGRPVQILSLEIFKNITIQNAFAIKWSYLPALIIYTTVLFRWLCIKTGDSSLSFVLAGILSFFPPAMDLLGYSATSVVCYSFLFSALSIYCFDHAFDYDWKREKTYILFNIILAFIMLFVALLTYQVGVQIVFLFLSVGIYFNKNNQLLLRKNLAYLMLFAISNGSILLFNKFLTLIYHVEIGGNRSRLINSLGDLVNKVHFYSYTVLTQTIKQVIASFIGGDFFLERFHGAGISLSNPLVGHLLFYFVALMILIALAGYWIRTRNFLGLLFLVAFIPSSYFVFLVLSENGYFTYYAFGHISLLMFYFLMGLVTFIQWTWRIINEGIRKVKTPNPLRPHLIIGPLLIICVFVSHYYTSDFYVGYNTAVYASVKNRLQPLLENGDIKRIHVNGLISPLNADVYSLFITQTALKDLGRNVGDYQITFSRNKYFLMRLEQTDYLRIYNQLSQTDQHELEKMYSFDPTYRQYSLNAWPSDPEKNMLQTIFMNVGAIPQESSTDTLVIDLTWTDIAFYNH